MGSQLDIIKGLKWCNPQSAIVQSARHTLAWFTRETSILLRRLLSWRQEKREQEDKTRQDKVVHMRDKTLLFLVPYLGIGQN